MLQTEPGKNSRGDFWGEEGTASSWEMQVASHLHHAQVEQTAGLQGPGCTPSPGQKEGSPGTEQREHGSTEMAH